jgi:hypothetical protein
MARNLIKAGHSLVVHSRSRGPVDEIVKAGAKAAASPKEVAAQCDVLVTMLPNSPEVEQVALGPSGIIEGARRGLTFLDMSTISPIVSQKVGKALAAKGVDMLDAPVSGGEKGAIDGALGGDAEVRQHRTAGDRGFRSLRARGRELPLELEAIGLGLLEDFSLRHTLGVIVSGFRTVVAAKAHFAERVVGPGEVLAEILLQVQPAASRAVCRKHNLGQRCTAEYKQARRRYPTMAHPSPLGHWLRRCPPCPISSHKH